MPGAGERGGAGDGGADGLAARTEPADDHGDGAAAGPPTSSVRYIRMFNGFFRDAAMTSTYKIALLRSLVDVGGYGGSALAGGQWIGHLGDGRLVVDLNFVAARFAKFYWDTEVGFGFLHIAPGSGARRRPRRLLMSRIVEEAAAARAASGDGGAAGAASVPCLDEIASGSMAGLRARTIAVIQRYVLGAVSRDMGGLYEILPGRRHIAFGPDLVCFMREHGPVVKRALNHKLAVLLESLNPDAVHIATKTDEAPLAERMAAAQRLGRGREGGQGR